MHVDIIFLSETNSDSKHISYITNMIDISHSFVVDSVHHNGGIACLWNDIIKLDVYCFTRHYMIFKALINNNFFFLTCIYEEHVQYCRSIFWNNFLNALNPLSSPLIIIGDFNDIDSYVDHFGGSFPNITLFANFSNALGLHDISYKGPTYT